MSPRNPLNLNQKSTQSTMQAQAIETSFDVICESSQLRHFKIIDRVRKALRESQPQSDQTESVLQRLVDEAQGIVDRVLLNQTKRSNDLASAEYVAERWDRMLWGRYLEYCNLNEPLPFQYPQYDPAHDGTPAPEHIRITESYEQATETVAGPSSSAAPARPPPDVEIAQEVPAQNNPAPRPVREDLPKAVQDRVLPLKVRQEIWEKHFPNCEKQDGAEPLQLQIPRNKTSSLLVGRIESDGQVTTREVFDRLRCYLPWGIDIIYQDSSDERFGFTLLYIGLVPGLKDRPQIGSAIMDLHGAWAMLWPWARLVNEGYDINAVKFARWHVKNEIKARRQKALDVEGRMVESLAFVEQEHIRRDHSITESHGTVPNAPRFEPGQHQDEMLAEREAV